MVGAAKAVDLLAGTFDGIVPVVGVAALVVAGVSGVCGAATGETEKTRFSLMNSVVGVLVL